MDDNNHSPVIPMKGLVLLDFPDAMRAVIEGKKITKGDWGTHYAVLQTGWLMYHKEDGFHIWQVRDVDMNATDYTVLETVN
jgi:hypothetical protein